MVSGVRFQVSGQLLLAETGNLIDNMTSVLQGIKKKNIEQ